MMGWIAFSTVVCIISAILGFGAIFSISPMVQGAVLLIMALSGIILLGAFEAYELSTRRDRAEDA